MSNALIIVDLEGCVGVTRKVRYGYSMSAEMRNISHDYRQGCTLEVIACVEGLKIAGFSQVHVYEGHPGIVLSHLLPAGVAEVPIYRVQTKWVFQSYGRNPHRTF